MSKLLILVLLFITAFAFGQDYGGGIYYGAGAPTLDVSAYQTRFYCDTLSQKTYVYDTGTTWTETTGGSSFDGDRDILRTFYVGLNTGSSTMVGMFEWMYFAPPTIVGSFATNPIYEVGTSTAKTWTTTTTNLGLATLSNGQVFKDITQVQTFGSNVSDTYNYTFIPVTNITEVYKSTQDWVKGTENGTAETFSVPLRAVHPFFMGTATTSYVDGNAFSYSEANMNKYIETEGNKSKNVTGTNTYIYILIPKTWADFTLSSIKDGNGFEVLPSFTSFDVNVTSTGLVNNYTQAYRCYKLGLTTVNATYMFTQ